jgi:cyclase
VFGLELRHLTRRGPVVELHHFGHGNTPGDTVVYVREAKAAWTGNLVLGARTIPWAIEGGAQAYLETLSRMAVRIDIGTIVGGHVLVTSGQTLTTYLRYLAAHIDAVRAAIRAGKTLEQTLASLPLEETYLPPEGSHLAQLRPVMRGVHLWNVKKTYLELSGQ